MGNREGGKEGGDNEGRCVRRSEEWRDAGSERGDGRTEGR